jgi:hypothetical protein
MHIFIFIICDMTHIINMYFVHQHPHTSQVVRYELWIKVPRVVSQWGFTDCMCQQKVNTTSKPWKGSIDINSCTSVGTPASKHPR